jgi:putative ABC transport system substrate-binding protein
VALALHNESHNSLIRAIMRLHLKVVLAGALLCVSNLLATVHAQQSPPASTRIGFLSFGSAGMIPRAVRAFREELAHLGYVEGSTLHIEERWANGDFSRLAGLANQLIQENVDIVVATSTQDVRAAQKATSTIPIVMVGAADPVATGLVADLAHPEGNVTGLSLMTIELTAKRLQVLRDTLPNITRIAVLWDPAHPFHSKVVEAIKSKAPSLSLQPTFVAAQSLEQIPAAFRTASRARAQALFVIEDPLFYLHRAAIAELAAKGRLPAVYGAREYVHAGGLMSYGPNYEDLWRRAAHYVDRIRRGAKPSELPIEQPVTFEFVVSLKMADRLGVALPQAMLVQATEVIR